MKIPTTPLYIAAFATLFCCTEDKPKATEGAGGNSEPTDESSQGGNSAGGHSQQQSPQGAEGRGVGGRGGAGVIQGGSAGQDVLVSTSRSGECTPPKLKLTRVAMADSPMMLAQPMGQDEMFIAERGGRIRILKSGVLTGTPFLDMSTSVYRPAGDNERGLLGLALSPRYKDDGRFFVFYTRSQNDPYSQGNPGDVVIAEGKRRDSQVAERATKPISIVRHDYDDFHNGGFLAFGKDGMLYAAVGDSGMDGYRLYNGMEDIQAQISGRCQDPKDTLCKILRIDVDQPTTRPQGNWPDGDIHVWALGVRNPYRGSFDRLTGDLFFGDVGEHSWEEVNYAPFGEAGKNWGWALAEGAHCFPWYHKFPCEPQNAMPILEYFHAGDGVTTDPKSYMMMGKACTGTTMADCSRAVIGGYVYRGAKIPALHGRYLYGDHVKNFVNSFVLEGGKPACNVDLTADLQSTTTPLAGIVSFSEDAQGEVYILDLFGDVYRIDPE